MTKTCTKCKTLKGKEDFTKRGDYPDGRYNVCKVCENAAAKRRKLERGKRVMF